MIALVTGATGFIGGSLAASLSASGWEVRVLVRPSGTEPAIRVMVEGTEAGLVVELADELAALAGERLN